MNGEGNGRGWLKALVTYFGLLQTVHFIAILIEGTNLLRLGEIRFLAPAPSAGWSPDAQFMLMGMGTADALLIVGSWIFVLGWYGRKPWAEPWGLAVMLAFSATALVFAVGTGMAGAWAISLNYWVMTVLFLPVVPLLLALLVRILRSRPAANHVNGQD